MQCIIASQEEAGWQTLSHEWYGYAVTPAFRFRFILTPEGLQFHAARKAAALAHPDARPGSFHAGLWQYDTAEFFISTPDATRYLEFNLNPRGAWWACVFDAPRQPSAALTGWRPQARTQGNATEQGWECRAIVPWEDWNSIGINPRQCRLAACAILESPRQIFLTTAEGCCGNPDFHLPLFWPEALLPM